MLNNWDTFFNVIGTFKDFLLSTPNLYICIKNDFHKGSICTSTLVALWTSFVNLPSWDTLGTETPRDIKMQRWVSGLQTAGDRRQGGNTRKEAIESNILCSALPFLGVHRQVLLATAGWFLGYHLTKYENYFYAKVDRDMNEYIRLHPEEFPPKGEWIIGGFILVTDINTLTKVSEVN